MIAIALKGHAARVRVIVPFYAMSGGTLIALAADEVLMEPYSILGPVDPQIAGLPATALLRVVQQKPIHAIDDKTLILADTARLAVQGVKAFVGWLLADRMPATKAAEVAEFLTGGYITHDTPLTMAVAQNLGLNVQPGIPPAVYDLFSTCAFGVCKRPCLAQYDGPGVAPEAPAHRLSWE